MGKCPRCPWTGSARAFQKHWSAHHYKKKKKKGKVKTFKAPKWGRKRRK